MKMKFIFSNKRIIVVLSAALIYSMIFGIVGHCGDYSQTLLTTNVNAEQIEATTSDTYSTYNHEVTSSTEISLWKAGISQYSVFDDFENAIIPSASDTTVVTTAPTKVTTTVATNLPTESFTKKPEDIAVNPGATPDSNPPPAHAEEITMKVTVNGQVTTLPAYDVLCRLLQQELNTGHIEAMKAQAVAAYTYYKYYEARDKYLSVNMGSTTPINQYVKDAVSAVLGVGIYYNGAFIYAQYCASTGGATANSKDVWSGGYDYLVSVESKYDNLANGIYYKSTKTFTEAEIRKLIEDKTNITLSNNPSNWFTFLGADQGGVLAGGFVGKMLIDGNSTYISKSDGKRVTITGRVVRESLLNLRSAKFEIAYADGKFTFTTYGYGHGVGLSQIGATLYAQNEGWTYDQILKHYYTGVEVK